MLDFPQEFFLEETREGFTIDTTMKTFWAAEMEVLREIAEICERHNLQWYAAYGTLLGTVRHEGFVPWDDDMDIWMKREDYNKFMELAQKELPEEFVVRSPLTENGYTEFHSCVFNALSVSVSEERLRNFHGCPFAVGLDIFPLDYLPDNEVEREGQKAILELVRVTTGLIKKKERTEEDEIDLQDALDTLEEVCGVVIHREQLGTNREDEVVSAVYKLANQLCTCYKEEDGSYLAMYMDYVKWPRKIYKKEWFDEIIEMPFEGFLIPVSAYYDNILKITYGDYHKRVRSVGCHEYPLYNKQLEYLRKVMANMEEKAARIDELIELAKKKRLEQQGE